MKLLKQLKGTSIYIVGGDYLNPEYLIVNDCISERRQGTLKAYSLFYAIADNVPENDLLYKIANQ